MKVDTYRSRQSLDQFLTVPTGTRLSSLPLPINLAQMFANADQFWKGEEIEPTQSRAGMNTTEILADIARQGFASRQATVTVKAVT